MPLYKEISISKCRLCKLRHIDDILMFGHAKVTSGKTKVPCDVCDIFVQAEYLSKHKTRKRHCKNATRSICSTPTNNSHYFIDITIKIRRAARPKPVNTSSQRRHRRTVTRQGNRRPIRKPSHSFESCVFDANGMIILDLS
jgi:hypothetical protein